MKRIARVLIVITILPMIVLLWTVGWSLLWIGSSEGEKPKPHLKQWLIEVTS